MSSTSDQAGSPFSFQNVAITVAVERYLRGGLAELIDTVRSIRASSPRVATNWDVGLAFTLAESGHLGEARVIFDEVARDGFDSVPRDLNWLVTMHLIGLIALRLDDPAAHARLLDLLEPFAHLDATHGSGYASYGPVGRVVGALAARVRGVEGARPHFELIERTREPGPWTTLARLDWAAIRRSVEPEAAVADAVRAEAELRLMGMDSWARSARDLLVSLLLEGHGGPAAVRTEAGWALRHPTGAAALPDGVGARQLVELLARPGRAVEVTQLDTHVDQSLPATATSDGIDRTAQLAYRRRLQELEGRAGADPTEIEFLRRELAGSRHVRSAEPELERARVRVTKALKRAVAAVGDQDEALGSHLAAAVHTGRRCSYEPADGRAWRVVAAGPA